MEDTDNIFNLIEKLDKKIDHLTDKLEIVEEKIDNIYNKIDCDVTKECKKMGEHIDFIENVYDNVKHPLGYICNKIKSFSSSDKQHSLTDIDNTSTTNN